jgi:hypothetical protein
MVAAELRELGGESVDESAAEGGELGVIGDGVEGKDDEGRGGDCCGD